MALPYPGYSWQITQHEIGLDAHVIYELLACASFFEGQANVGHQITNLMVESGLLTENVRDGHADAWRDYQQILPELGLIYSTKVSPQIQLTEVGKLYLLGGIGFSELVSMQALRYQYPNGHKTQMSSRLKALLQAAGVRVPSSVMELQAESGVLVKPGLLIFRVLLELYKNGYSPRLSVAEVESFLLPIKINTEWPIALSKVVSSQESGSRLPSQGGLVVRNIRTWFRLLGKSDLFQNEGAIINLSSAAIAAASKWSMFCDEQENLSTFWIPVAFEREDKMSWFSEFGRVDSGVAHHVLTEEVDASYLRENYAAGTDLDEDKDENVDTMFSTEIPALSFREVSTQNYGSGRVGLTPQEALENIEKGAIKRKIMAELHDKIVQELADDFTNKGADVKEDRNSADLFVTWTNGAQTIFEVKTVSPRSLPQRLRSCVGQVLEYGYRYSSTSGSTPEMVAVLNLGIPADAWQVKYLNDFLDIGLLCRDGENRLTYPGRGSEDCQWCL